MLSSKAHTLLKLKTFQSLLILNSYLKHTISNHPVKNSLNFRHPSGGWE